MPDTSTAELLALTLQTNGENDGTWGDKVDTNFERISRATGGHLSKSVAGSSNVSLTQTESENAVIDLTGTLTGDIEVHPINAKEKAWWIKNSTSGSFTITFKPSGGTGIVVPQGDLVCLYSDGTNIAVLSRPAAIVQVATASYSTETTTTSTTYQDVFSLNFALKDSSNTVLLMFQGAVGCKQSSGETAGALWRIYDSTDTAEVADLLCRISAGSNASGDVDWLQSGAISKVHSPGDTSTHTYKLQHKTESGGTQTAFTCVGMSESKLIAMELAA